MPFDVFGYGSLVNRGTLPPYLSARRASVAGWRRAWRATSAEEDRGGVCSLSVVEAPDAMIDGLVITFPDEMRPIIDAREHRYDPLSAVVGADPVILFRASPDIDRFGDVDHPIHLSYLDCIVQGFVDAFGPDGVLRFGQTTDGWHVPILDDRVAPRYPRAQRLTAEERAAVDELLIMVDATVIGAE